MVLAWLTVIGKITKLPLINLNKDGSPHFTDLNKKVDLGEHLEVLPNNIVVAIHG